MMQDNFIIRQLVHSRLIAVTVFVVLVGAFVAATWSSIADITLRRSSLAENAALLDQLKGRRTAGPMNSGTGQPTGSPFLEGPTVTVAGATLLQRVAGAITQAGGVIQSSQVDVEGVQAKDGFLSLLVSCEIEQNSLQNLLYDIEAGMPFLFVDQLDVQMPQGVTAGESTAAKVRVLLGVSGKWQAAK
jgi:general secretion pathway protein M